MASNVFKFNSVIRLAKFASAPADAAEGYMYYDTTEGAVKIHNGTSYDAVAANEVMDGVFRIVDTDDSTKEIAFDAGSITTETTRTITMPDTDIDLGSIATAQSAAEAAQDDATQALSDAADAASAASTAQGNVNNLVTLSGVVVDSTTLGTFTGSTIADSSTVKAALQSLETAVELAPTTTEMNTAIDNALAGLDFQPDVLNIQVDATLDPGATPTDGDRYIITDFENLHANFGTITGVANNDIVEYVTDAFVVAYDVSVQGEGALCWDQDGNTWQRFDGTDWAEFGGLTGITAGDGLTKTGNTISVDIATTNPGLEFGSSGDAGKIQAKVDGTTITKGASGLAVGTVGDSNISTGIDAEKLADGTVTNTEFQYINSLSSNAQDQIDGKIGAVSEDSAPSLGGNLTLGNSNILIEGTSGLLRGDATNFIEEDYKHGITLTASQTATVLSDLTFAHASYEGMEVVYKVKEATTNRVRIGRFTVVTDGTNVSISDTFNETADCGIVWDAAVNGANVEMKYTTTANNKVMHCDVKRIKA